MKEIAIESDENGVVAMRDLTVKFVGKLIEEMIGDEGFENFKQVLVGVLIESMTILFASQLQEGLSEEEILRISDSAAQHVLANLARVVAERKREGSH